MISKQKSYSQAYVWIWLPNDTKPTVAGKLSLEGPNLVFNYGQSYLERENKISLYDRELPLQAGILPLPSGLSMPGCIRDGSPDAWGRRVVINALTGKTGRDIDATDFGELTYLMESGSDRIGALDFQSSSTKYEPRASKNVTLEELMASAERVEQGIPLSDELDLALHHGSAIGGARPKALIEAEDIKYIAKFSSTSDIYSVVKAEYVAMRLAQEVGISAAPVALKKSLHKDVLLIERFDRVRSKAGFCRKSVISALTLFELDEMMARYGSYERLCEIIRHRFTKPRETLKELFRRLVFNILVGNTDDHARNHAAFWDGSQLTLTPAYDICPQLRSGNMANQAMFIHGSEKKSQIESCLAASTNFLLSREEGLVFVRALIQGIIDNWDKVCIEAHLNKIDRKLFCSRQFLNPYAFENLGTDAGELVGLAKKFKEKEGSSL